MGNSQKSQTNAKRAYFQTLALYGRYHQASMSVQEILDRHSKNPSHNLITISLEAQAAFKELPAEIVLQIFTYLNIAEWQMYSIVCKKWREYLHLADYVWHCATHIYFPSLFPQNDKNIKNMNNTNSMYSKTQKQQQLVLGANYVPPIPLPNSLPAIYNNSSYNWNNPTTAKTCRQINNNGVASQHSSAWKRLFLNDLIASVAIFNYISCKLGIE